MAPFVKELNVRSGTGVLLKYLPQFTSLRSLGIFGLTITKFVATILPVDVQSVRLKPLSIQSENVYPSLLRLTNLREVLINHTYDKNVISEVLDRNSDSLEHIILVYGARGDPPSIDWQSVKTMQNLKQLTFQMNEYDPFVSNIYNSRFYDEITERRIVANLENIFSNIGSRLQNIELEIDLKWVARAICGSQLNNLKELTFNNSIIDISGSQLESLGSFDELRKVVFTQKCTGTLQAILNIKKLVNSCYKLEKLILPGFTTRLSLGEELKDFFSKSKTRLKINGFIN